MTLLTGMTATQSAALWSGLLILLLVILSVRVVQARRKHRVLLGDGGVSQVTVAGRVFRTEDLGQFSIASGLDGRRSDWLAAAQLTFPTGMGVTQRLLM
ncbi:MAG: MAPEG family protein, partial [Brevundimonas sp.]|nr:MAPEG family protein [Brevundimonas sp.]